MRNKKEVVEMLSKAAEKMGVAETISSFFGNNVRVSIPFGKAFQETSIEELNFSVRASNCLHRAGRVTVGDVIDVINSEELLGYRNIGRKTVSEIKTKLLVYGYYKLNDIERAEFWYDFLERNCKAQIE